MASYQVFVILVVLFFTPSLTFVSLGASSLAPGLVVASLIISACLFSFVLKKQFSFLSLVFCLFVFLFYIFLPALSAAYHEQLKPIISLCLLFIVFLSSIALFSGMSISSYSSLSRGLVFFVCFLLFLGWFEIVFGFHFGVYALREKPVFPFSEQSHYALSVGLLAGPAFVNSSKKIKALVVINFLLQGILFPNLTLIVFCFILLYLFFVIHKPKLLFCFALLLIFLVFYYMYFSDQIFSDNGYFASRLNISSDSENLTTLVFLQGWEQAIIALKESGGFGVGFQMLGSESPGTFSSAINLAAGGDLNREDGGLLAAKIIGEFGVFGILVIFLYLYVFLNVSLKFKSYCNEAEKKKLIYCSFFIMFFVEMFFRGYGYFSPGFVVFIASVFSLMSHIKEFKKIK